MFFLVGADSAAKTSIFVHSGVEPDLLAGQVYQDNAIISTRPVNIWLAQKSVFVEPGGRMLDDPGRWITLMKRMNPSRSRIFNRKPQAPRGAIVCIDSDTFLRADATEALTLAARNLRTRLGEISQTLGIRLPVYVLFSKLDRLGYFTDFVANLTDEEATQVLGVTLPLLSDREQGGVYAEEESRRLTAAFDGLFRALCDKRPPFLAREHDPNKLPPVYEFPREFRKMRNSAVRFLVDLGRPSQLRANPFLRGFYFSGVRPIVVTDSAPAARAAAPPVRRAATGFFTERAPVIDDPINDPARTRRIPQWVFLGHLFSDVVLRDRAAMGASGHSLRTELARRVLAASAAVLCVLWAVGMTVSFFRNRALESSLADAVRGIGQAERSRSSNDVASLDTLEKLEAIRGTVNRLSDYERDGAPWSMRWGLYVGHDLYPSARALYFDNFKQVMFGETQQALDNLLHQLPSAPDPKYPYGSTYADLRAYLITTSNPEKSTAEFLTPVLMEKWQAGRNVDQARQDLAHLQFDFYARELPIPHHNPYDPPNTDMQGVTQGRVYLKQFNAVDRLYQNMITDAVNHNPPVNFNKKYPGSANFEVNDKDVAGAFSLDGWKYVNDLIAHVSRIQGEPWVLGDDNGSLDLSLLGPQLRDRYHKDFIGNWRQYLVNSHLAPYHSLQDASTKLTQLSGNQSYLLALFCLASVNISVATDDITAPYKPVLTVTPPNCANQYVQGANTGYIGALANLQTAIDRLVKNTSPQKDDAIKSTMDAADAAINATRAITGSFPIDPEGGIVDGNTKRLMLEPITQAQALLGGLGPAQINSAGAGMCDAFNQLLKKYPFETKAPDATLDELNSVLRPGDGKLPQFYENTLKSLVDKQGNQYVAKPGSKVSPEFLTFFNRAMAFSGALYKNGAQAPSLTYSMRALPFEGLKSVTLSLDGQVLKSGPAGGQSQDFTWPGTSVQKAALSGNAGGTEFGYITYDGLWAAFRFFGDADSYPPSGTGYQLSWVPRQGKSNQPTRLDNGKTLTLPFQLELKGAPPVFLKDYLASFHCVSRVVR